MACGGRGKSWMMMLCCIIPIAVILALPLLGIQNQFTSWLVLLACPLAMMAMMLMHNKSDKKKCH